MSINNEISQIWSSKTLHTTMHNRKSKALRLSPANLSYPPLCAGSAWLMVPSVLWFKPSKLFCVSLTEYGLILRNVPLIF